jgi:uncharacterized protein YggE
MSEGNGEMVGDEVTRSQRGSTPGSLHPTQWIVALVAVLVVAAVGLAGVALGHSQSTPKGTIAVTGSGTVQGTPDTVSFQIGVQNVAKSAVLALSANSARVSSLENSLLGHGVTQKDMQTSGLDIYENSNDQGTVTGFTVIDDLNVTMHQIARAGAAIDAAVHAAGDGAELYGVSFSISNESKLLAAARAKAMANARTEASQVAGGGASLGTVEKITDQENLTSAVLPYSNFRASGLSASVPLKPGSQSINVEVSVVYALNN